jgi:hypothetical protein
VVSRPVNRLLILLSSLHYLHLFFQVFPPLLVKAHLFLQHLPEAYLLVYLPNQVPNLLHGHQSSLARSHQLGRPAVHLINPVRNRLVNLVTTDPLHSRLVNPQPNPRRSHQANLVITDLLHSHQANPQYNHHHNPAVNHLSKSHNNPPLNPAQSPLASPL